MNLRTLLYTTALSVLLAVGGCGKKESPVEPAVNHAPTIERIVANPSEPYTDEKVGLECIANDDEDGDNLNYDWRCDKGHFENGIVNEKQVTWNSPNEIGNYYITIKVEDTERASDSKGLELRVISRFDTILVAEDAYVDEDNPQFSSQNDSYYKNELDLYKEPEGVKYPYLRFDLTTKSIRSAKLRLSVTAYYVNNDDLLPCYFYGVTESWSQGTIDYDNQPNYNPLPIAYFEIPYTDMEDIYIPLTDVVKEWVNNPSENHGFNIQLLRTTSNYRGYSFISKEGSDKPMMYSPALILEYE